MSDDISEVGKFEPREYLGMFLTEQLTHRPDLEHEKFLKELGSYRVYSTPVEGKFYLVDDDSGHYFLARPED